jgi:2-phosphoglycerate kinase
MFWITLHRSIPPELAPELHLLDGRAVWSYDPPELVERYLRVSAYVSEAIEPVVAHHHIIGRRVIIEGSWVLPRFAVQGTYAGTDTGDSVRSLFLSEPDLSVIEARIRARPHRWLENLEPHEQKNHLEVQRLYGERIKAQAEALGLPVLESRPSETLEERALAAIGLGESMTPRLDCLDYKSSTRLPALRPCSYIGQS